MEEFAKIFDGFDVDNNGQLDKSEMIAFLTDIMEAHKDNHVLMDEEECRHHMNNLARVKLQQSMNSKMMELYVQMRSP